MRLSIVPVVLAAILVGPVVGLAQARSGATLSLTITALHNPVKAGSEVRVEIVVTNISKREIVVSRSNGEGEAEISGYAAEVQDGKGNPIPGTKYSQEITGPETANAPLSVHVTIAGDLLVPLQPGKRLKDMLIVSKFWDMSHPGVYKIQVVRTDPETRAVVKSNVITVIVTP